MFPEMELSSSNIKKILIFSYTFPKESCSYIFGNELSCSNIEKFLYFLKRKHVLYFQKQNPALFSPNPKNKRTPFRENLLCFMKRKP